jgi:sec-independent protein translocase protein TatA
MASLSATATVVRPGLARGKTSAPKAQAPKSCAMSGLTGSAPAFLGKPSALSAGIVSAGGARGAGSRSVATMGLFGLGLPELVVIGGVAAVLFGPSKLPELGKSLGKTVKSFQAAANVRTRPHPRASEDPRSSSHSATRVLELLPLS